MLWSLAKVILFFTMVAGLTWGASYLSAAGGGMRMALLGYEVTLGPLQAVLALMLMAFGLWLVFRIAGLILAIVRFMMGDETALSRHFDRNRERRGLNALAEAITAQASGEHRIAMARAAKAERLLGRPDLGQVITAQSALALGELPRAEAAYRALLSDDRSRFIGIQGLMKLKMAEGDLTTSRQLAEKALALKPKDSEAQDLLLRVQTASGDWAGLRETLNAQWQSGRIPKDVWKRRDALAALQLASEGLEDTAAQDMAIAAHKAAPDLVPAAVLAARAHLARQAPRAAIKVLTKAWATQPHPDLAVAFAEIEPGESPNQRLDRFRTLIELAPDHPESRLLEAELKIAAEDFPGAQRALGDLVTTQPSVRAMTIMAAIERGIGADDAVVRGWMARALTAPRGAQWVCEKCHAIHKNWAPSCDQCHGFDTLSWTEVREATGASATQSEMLPLLVGRPAAASAPTPEPAPVEEVEEAEVLPPDEVARRGAF